MNIIKKYKIYSYIMHNTPVVTQGVTLKGVDSLCVKYNVNDIIIRANHLDTTNLYYAEAKNTIYGTVEFYGRMAQRLYEHGAKQK